MDKNDFIALAAVATVPLIGAASAVTIEKTATKYGYTFLKFGPNNLFLIGTIGAVQNLASLVFRVFFKEYGYNGRNSTLMGHGLSGGLLVGMSAVAAKLNLISARLTIVAGTVLITTSLIQVFAITKIARSL